MSNPTFFMVIQILNYDHDIFTDLFIHESSHSKEINPHKDE